MRNPFIVDASELAGIPQPDIEVPLREQYGQVAEDVIVEGLLMAWSQRTGNGLSTCRYLEIGANHPFATSSSYLLQRMHGMTGVLVDANEDLVVRLRATRPADDVVFCAVTAEDTSEVEFFVSNQSELSSLSRRFVEEWQGGAVGLAEVRKVPAMRANALLEEHFSAKTPVFLSVDVEGLDLAILQDVDWVRWRPVVVQAEPSDHFIAGQSTAIATFMHQKGYVLIARTAVNMIFCDREALFGGPLRALEVESSSTLPVPTAPFLVPKPNYSEAVSVGIVMRTKNRTVLLRRAMDSVKHQTYPHWQLVIVNDGGDPAPVDQLVEAIFGDDDRVTVVHHPVSVGMEAASNSGISRLRTELAAIHDDDDTWAPDMLGVATAVLRSRNASMPSIRGVVTRVNLVQETVVANHIRINNIQPWNEASPDRLSEGLISLARLVRQNLFPPIAFIFDLGLARKLGGFDQDLPVLGDWDFHMRFCEAADIWVHPELLAFYHLRMSATGELGNTVVAGKAKHDLYNTYVRNKFLREANNPVAAALALLREQGLAQETLLGHLGDTQNPLLPSSSIAVPPRKKSKSKLGIFLSELNRKRKRLFRSSEGKR